MTTEVFSGQRLKIVERVNVLIIVKMLLLFWFFNATL
jgi:hypothetical protein